MRFYIASHSQEEARAVADILQENGYDIVSSWLNEDFSRTSTYTDEEKAAIANKDIDEVWQADALVLLPSPIRVAGGKFVEAGAAIALGKPVYVIGVRENILLYHRNAFNFRTVEDLLEKLQGFAGLLRSHSKGSSHT